VKTKTDKGDAATGHVTLSPTGVLQIKFPYDPIVINKVKTLSGRLWHSGPKHWTAPLTAENVNKLREWKFSLSGDVVMPLLEQLAKKSAPLPAIDFGDLDGVLDDFQKEGVQRIEAFGGRALLADDPGLGKTPQCLMWLRAHPELRPAVVITKATGKLVWQRIAKRGILPDGSDDYVPLLPDDRVQVIFGEKPVDIDADVIIANYDILARVDVCPDCEGEGEVHNRDCETCKGKGSLVRLRADIDAIKPAVVVVDEPQMISNPGAQRPQATLALTAKVRNRHLLAATASPIKRRPRQFFNILHELRPDIWHSFWHFGQEFCDGKHNGYGWNFEGSSNLNRLHAQLVEHVMIRRRKEDVLGRLPLYRQIVPLEIKNAGEYARADADFMEWLWATKDGLRYDKAKRAEGLVRASTLLRMAAERKTDACVEWIREFLDDGDKKLIAFTMHTALLDTVVAAFPDISVKLDGSSSAKERQAAEDRFQNDPDCRLFGGNSDAAGDTITLTAAYDVAFLELPKTPEDVKQNEGRAYGRMNDPHGINSWFLVAANTIEEERAEQLNIGARVVGAVLDGRPQDEGEDLIQLITRRMKS